MLICLYMSTSVACAIGPSVKITQNSISFAPYVQIFSNHLSLNPTHGRFSNNTKSAPEYPYKFQF
jgi:hypothetical protein